MGSPSPVHHLWLPSTPGIEHPTRTGPWITLYVFPRCMEACVLPQPGSSHTPLSPPLASWETYILLFPFKGKQVCRGPEWTSISIRAGPGHGLESQPHCVFPG